MFLNQKFPLSSYEAATSVDINELDRHYLAEMKHVQDQREAAIRNLDVVMSQRREFLKHVYDEQMRLIDLSRRMEIKLKRQLDIGKNFFKNLFFSLHETYHNFRCSKKRNPIPKGSEFIEGSTVGNQDDSSKKCFIYSYLN